MDEKLSQVILDFERISGKTLEDTSRNDPNGHLSKSRFNFGEALNNKIYHYVLLPISILVLLILCRPKFLYVQNGANNRVFSITKLISYTIILSIIVLILYFVLQYQLKPTA